MDLDSILSWAIPTAIGLFGAFYFYKLLQEPIDRLFGFFKGLVTKGKDKVEGNIENEDDWRYYPRR